MKTLTFEQYVAAANSTCLPSCFNEQYLGYGLFSELGEVYGKLKKAIRDGVPINFSESMCYELGDVVWYCAMRLRLCYGEELPTRVWNNFLEPVAQKHEVYVTTGIPELQREAIRACAFLMPYSTEEKLSNEAVYSAVCVILRAVDALAITYGSSLEQVAVMNVEKLRSRKERNQLHGSGDNR